MSVKDAQEQMRMLMGDGTHCPVCTQDVKVYPRSLTKGMVEALDILSSEADQQYVNLDSFFTVTHKRADLVQGGDLQKARYWGLLKKRPRVQGEKHTFWRTTQVTTGFLEGNLRLPKITYVFNKLFLGFSDETVSISDVRKEPFHYDKMMRVYIPPMPVNSALPSCDPQLTLKDAIDLVENNKVKGIKCPLCGQTAKINCEGLVDYMVFALKTVVDEVGTTGLCVSVPEILKRHNISSGAKKFALLRHWGLITPVPDKRNDGSERAGIYSLNALAFEFVSGGVKIPRSIFLFNQELAGKHTELVSFEEAINTKFDPGSQENYLESQ